MKKITDWLEENKKQLILALVFTFIVGMAAHGFAFANSAVSHDSLREFHSEIQGNDLKRYSGRFVTPIYKDLIGNDITFPWLGGILALLWISLMVFLIAKLFRVKSKPMLFLFAGILVTNISVSAIIATYIHDFDSYMFSVLCSVAAVYVWNAHRLGWLAGAGMILLSLGIYQSNLFVAVGLAMMVCLFALLNGEAFGEVFRKGLKAIGMLILGGIGYYVARKCTVIFLGVTLSSGEYNSLDRMLLLNAGTIVPLIADTYRDFFARLFDAYSSYPSIMIRGMTVVFLAIDIAAVTAALCSRKIHWKEKVLLACIVLLFPLGTNMIYVLTVGETHDLMTYPSCLFYLLTLLLADSLYRRCKANKHEVVRMAGNWQRIVCMLLVGVCIYGNVRFSNGMYMKKKLEYDGNLSLMTRVVGRMEMLDDYVPGETPVVFVGLPKAFNKVIPGFMDYWNVTGMEGSSTIYIAERARFQAYFDYILSAPIQLAENDIWTECLSLEMVEQMPCYPANGCMTYYADTLIVKLGDVPK